MQRLQPLNELSDITNNLFLTKLFPLLNRLEKIPVTAIFKYDVKVFLTTKRNMIFDHIRIIFKKLQNLDFISGITKGVITVNWDPFHCIKFVIKTSSD